VDRKYTYQSGKISNLHGAISRGNISPESQHQAVEGALTRTRELSSSREANVFFFHKLHYIIRIEKIDDRFIRSMKPLLKPWIGKCLRRLAVLKIEKGEKPTEIDLC